MLLSLKLRQAIISLVLLLFILPASFLAIERAFFAQLITSTEQKLEVHLYSFLSELSSKNDVVEINNSILPADFLRADSGTTDPEYRPGFKKVLGTWSEAIRGWRSIFAIVLQHGFITLSQAKQAVDKLGGTEDRASWALRTGAQSDLQKGY